MLTLNLFFYLAEGWKENSLGMGVLPYTIIHVVETNAFNPLTPEPSTPRVENSRARAPRAEFLLHISKQSLLS